MIRRPLATLPSTSLLCAFTLATPAAFSAQTGSDESARAEATLRKMRPTEKVVLAHGCCQT